MLSVFGCAGSSLLQGLSLVVVHGLLIGVASLVVEHGLQGAWASAVVARGLRSCSSRALEHSVRSCGTQALWLWGRWDLPGPGIEPMSPSLADGFFNTETPGKP